MNYRELENIRLFLEQKWYQWKIDREKDMNLPLSEGMCNFSSFFMKELLGKEWRIAGGYSIPSLIYKEVKKNIPGGFCKNGQYYDHHWVTNGENIIDLTADQFGDKKIIITDKKDPRYIENIKLSYSVYKENAYSAILWSKEYKDMKKNDEIILYHGTTMESALLLMENGWEPNKYKSGNHCGQNKYLYLTNEPENAMWYSEEKGEQVVLQIRVPLSSLKVDPEDGIMETVIEELEQNVGNVVSFNNIPKEAFLLHHLTKKNDYNQFKI